MSSYDFDPGWGLPPLEEIANAHVLAGRVEQPVVRPLGELLPRTMPDRLQVWLYAGYGWSLEAVARLVGRSVRLVRNDVLFWRDLNRIELQLADLRATPRRDYSAELRHEVALWRERLRKERAKRARQDEHARRASLRAQDQKARPERYAYRDACMLRWRRRGLQGREIAARLGLSPARVYQKLHQLERRARRPAEPLLPLLSAAEARCMAVSVKALQGLLEERARRASLSLEELLEELEGWPQEGEAL